MDKELFQKNIHEFKWESKEQREGYLALVQYKLRHGNKPSVEVDLTEAFLIQKAHEAHLYYNEVLGTQISDLQNQIKKLLDNQ